MRMGMEVEGVAIVSGGGSPHLVHHLGQIRRELDAARALAARDALAVGQVLTTRLPRHRVRRGLT